MHWTRRIYRKARPLRPRLNASRKRLRQCVRRWLSFNPDLAASSKKQVSLTDPPQWLWRPAQRLVWWGITYRRLRYRDHLIVAHELSLTKAAHKDDETRPSRHWTKRHYSLCRSWLLSGAEIMATTGRYNIRAQAYTSGSKAAGRFGKHDFLYQPETIVTNAQVVRR